MRVLIAAGGTAGHINPALAIAGALKQADPAAEIHFAGRREGMEYGLVTKAGYPFHHIEINGFQRRLTPENIRRNLLAAYHLALSGPRTKAILKQVQPDLVIGCGGYVSGPVVRAAAKRGIRTAIHEQNAFPGVTNKLLAKDVDVVFAASADAVEKLGAPGKTLVVGNPVRPELLAQDRAAARARSPRRVHDAVRMTRVYNADYHFVAVFHWLPPLLLARKRYTATPIVLVSGTVKAMPLPFFIVSNFDFSASSAAWACSRSCVRRCSST